MVFGQPQWDMLPRKVGRLLLRLKEVEVGERWGFVVLGLGVGGLVHGLLEEHLPGLLAEGLDVGLDVV